MSKSSKPGKKILAWVGYISAVIGLIIGAAEVSKLIGKWKEEKEKINSLIADAHLQVSSGDYHGAWNNLELALAVEPASEKVQSEQAAVAMRWLKNIELSSARGETKFSQITDKLLPVLFHEVSVSQGRQKANTLAFMGWAGYLKFRDGEYDAKVEENFSRALQEDSSNVYAHVMWGFWMLYPGSHSGSVAEAKKHFAAAEQGDFDARYVRLLELSAYRNSNYDLNYTKEIFLVVNKMRISGDTLEADIKRKIVSDAYQSYTPLIDTIATVLLPEEHAMTFSYLTTEKNVAESLMLMYALAAITEKLPPPNSALTYYKNITTRESFPLFRYRKEIEKAIERLSK